MATTLAPEADLATLAQRSGTRFVLAMFVDLNGKPCAKLVPVEAIDELQNDGVGFAGYAVGAMGQEPRDPDLVAIPDATSFSPVPFVREGLAIVHCDPHVEGEPWRYAPRVILKRMLARARDQQLELFTGAEVEYFLLRPDGTGGYVPADTKDTATRPCYDARGVTRMFDHLAELSTGMNALGWGNYANDHEDGNGQFEQNFNYADALTTADRVVTLRYLISVLAERRDMVATFMPKPFTRQTGNGLHFHLSLWRDGAPLFPGHGDDDRGLGMSPLTYSFVGGILSHAGALQALLGPSVNSYKRTGAVSTSSGASWAPRFPTYGGNDRTHYIRVPDQHRIELRGGDGAANPYLATAGALGAGLAGIESELDPGIPGGDNGTSRPALPRTLLHAVDALEADDVVRSTLDAAGDGVAAYYAELKREEFFAYHSQVSAWETERYLTAY